MQHNKREMYSLKNDTYVGKPSNGDFVTAYASKETITVSSLPSGVSALTALDIISILVYSDSGKVKGMIVPDNLTVTVSGTTITVESASFISTDKFVVYTNIPREVTLTTGDIELGAVEIKDADTDTRQNISTVGSTNIAHTGIFNADGEQINSFGSPQLNGTHRSPTHFTAAYTSTSTLTLGGQPTISDNSQIVGIQVTTVGNETIQYIAGADNISFGYSSGVITIYKSGVAFAGFVSTDIAYKVVLNVLPVAQNYSNNSQYIQTVNPDYAQTDSYVTLVTAQDLTASYADFGGIIDCRERNTLGLLITRDINNSENTILKWLTEAIATGTLDAEITDNTVTLWTTTGASADGTTFYAIDVSAVDWIQLQAKCDAITGTAGDLTIQYTTKY